MNTVFIGNRFGVLETLLHAEYGPLWILAVTGSYLEQELKRRDIDYTGIDSKSELLATLDDIDYELLVSNGCPYLLPVSSLDNGSRTFVNVHPALLPEQRGTFAINGAMFHQYGAGATCHIMDDGVDTGPVIARVEIPYSPDLDLGMLYQLSFTAEVDAFTRAAERGFRPLDVLPPVRGEPRSFSRPADSPELDLSAGPEAVHRLVRAFGIASQGVIFHYRGKPFKVFDAEIVTNAYLLSKAGDYRQNEVAWVYDDTLVLRTGDGFVKLKGVRGAAEYIPPGALLK